MHEFILRAIEQGGLLGIFLLMAVENIFPPIPSEVIMGLGGVAVSRGTMDFWPLMIVGTVGSTAGNYVWYWLGDHWGRTRLEPFVNRWARWLTMEWQDVERAQGFFQRHGPWVVFVFRFTPVFRTMISLPAGLFRMGHLRFLLWTAGGALIWNIILAYAGYVLGRNFQDIDRYLGPAATICVVGAVILYLWRLATWRPRG